MFLILFFGFFQFAVLGIPSSQKIFCDLTCILSYLSVAASWTLGDDEFRPIKHKRIRPAYMRAVLVDTAPVVFEKYAVAVLSPPENPAEGEGASILLHPLGIRFGYFITAHAGCLCKHIDLRRRNHHLIVRPAAAGSAEQTRKSCLVHLLFDSLCFVHRLIVGGDVVFDCVLDLLGRVAEKTCKKHRASCA